jgi:hypothetical protein
MSYRLANSVTISTDIPNFGDSYHSNKGAKACAHITGPYLTFKYVPNDVISVAGYTTVSTFQWC